MLNVTDWFVILSADKIDRENSVASAQLGTSWPIIISSMLRKKSSPSINSDNNFTQGNSRLRQFEYAVQNLSNILYILSVRYDYLHANVLIKVYNVAFKYDFFSRFAILFAVYI